MNTIHTLLLTAASVLYGIGAAAQQLQPGDLLFHVKESPTAITQVRGDLIEHVAIALGTDSLIEATHRGVVITSVDSLPADGHYLIGRITVPFDLQRSLNNARSLLGRPYDYLFLPNNKELYCSELVQLSFVDSLNQLIFRPVPLSFHDATGRILDHWQQYYAARGIDVPEGQPGSHPSELAKRSVVRIIGRMR
jgi:hypothetical protein